MALPLGQLASNKRPKLILQAEGDGFLLNDELLLLVFAASSLDTDDLVRCAATCRRWRRLVAHDARYICRLKPPSQRFLRGLAVGFFHQSHLDDSGAPPRFVPFPSFSSSRCAHVFDDDLFRNSRLIASRNGRLVVELHRASRAAALRLAVCNPMIGDVSIIPTLSGKDRPGYYACALLTAEDLLETADPLPLGSTAFRLFLVYKRRNFTASRCYSSDTRAWGTEGKLCGTAKVSGRRLGEMTGGVAVRGAVFWLSRNVVLGVRVDSLEATSETFPWKWKSRLCFCLGNPMENRRLAVSPDGRLCVVQVGRPQGGSDNPVINVLCRSHGKAPAKGAWEWEKQFDVELQRLLPLENVGRVCLRGVMEKSGVVFLATGADRYAEQPDLALYALHLQKKEMRLVPAPPGRCCVRRSSWSFFGYEMDRVAYLTSLSPDTNA
ncbi:hypothetical protein GUJ93_ZPchr0008g12419 [Zizania palustris]|uniref:F-box domain-containing protein n=1 Tax=Zizania palustris TaxID=103762 RepID=A0A8J5R4G3_ZIZPA|nr:hypothetical protein GUJ93_ZPchr0008g12419 [Zizania palustris]